jgi:toxin YoeB
MKLVFSENGWSDYQYWQSQDKKTLKHLNRLIEEILRDPQNGTGKPESLKGSLSGKWSRRIDEQNRLVYQITGDAIEIRQCRGHYED